MKDYKYPEFKYPEEENSSELNKIRDLMISSQLTQSKLYQEKINIQQPSKYSLYPNVNEKKLGSENNPYGYSSEKGPNNPYGQQSSEINYNIPGYGYPNLGDESQSQLEENSSKMKKIEELMISSQLTQSKLFQNDKNKQIKDINIYKRNIDKSKEN